VNFAWLASSRFAGAESKAATLDQSEFEK